MFKKITQRKVYRTLRPIHFLVLAILLATTAMAQDDGYFTMVIFTDPHVGQSNSTTVEDMQAYTRNMVSMGQDGGPLFTFTKAPKGFVPRADIVFCLGDMDGDSEKQGTTFRSAVQPLTDSNIPFLVIAGNHDLVPDYWNGGDFGLTYAGYLSNACALGIATERFEDAQKKGIEDYTRINDGSGCIQTDPMVFRFHGVRFYLAQTYWFQKLYTKPSLLGKATLYRPDGVIAKLEEYLLTHADEPAIWMQHYPFVAGSDNDQWWTDTNDNGLVYTPNPESQYKTATARKDKMAALINQTSNPYHFSGHFHGYKVSSYTSTANTKHKVKDYVCAAPMGYGGNERGNAYIVLVKDNYGVVEVQQVSFDDRIHTYTIHITGDPTGQATVAYDGQDYADGGTLRAAEPTADLFQPKAITGFASEVSIEGTDINVTYYAAKKTAILNTRLFTLDVPRGRIHYNAAAQYLVNCIDENYDAGAEQWALLKSDRGNYYLYNYGARLFVCSGTTNGYSLHEEPRDPITLCQTGNDNYPFYFMLDDLYFNLGGSRQLTVDSWSTLDDGNQIRMVFAAKASLTDVVAAINQHELAVGIDSTGSTSPTNHGSTSLTNPNGGCYDLSGRPVSTPNTPGLYISRGRKVLVLP